MHPVERVTAETNKDPTTMSRDELTKTVSASKLEKLAISGNYKHFKAYHPGIPENHVKKVYNQIRLGNNLAESILAESPLEMDEYDKASHAINDKNHEIKREKNRRIKMTSKQKYGDSPKAEDFSHVSSTPTHHFDIKQHTHNLNYDTRKLEKMKNSEARDATFMAVDRKTMQPHMHVTGTYTPSKKHFEVDTLKGHPNSTIKAHDFYHHLLLAGHTKKLVSGATQSAGGRKVWKRLSQLPHVKLHTNDTKEPFVS